MNKNFFSKYGAKFNPFEMKRFSVSEIRAIRLFLKAAHSLKIQIYLLLDSFMYIIYNMYIS